MENLDVVPIDQADGQDEFIRLAGLEGSRALKAKMFGKKRFLRGKVVSGAVSTGLNIVWTSSFEAKA